VLALTALFFYTDWDVCDSATVLKKEVAEIENQFITTEAENLLPPATMPLILL